MIKRTQPPDHIYNNKRFPIRMADLHRKQTVHTLVAALVAFDMTTAKLQCRWHELLEQR